MCFWREKTPEIRWFEIFLKSCSKVWIWSEGGERWWHRAGGDQVGPQVTCDPQKRGRLELWAGLAWPQRECVASLGLWMEAWALAGAALLGVGYTGGSLANRLEGVQVRDEKDLSSAPGAGLPPPGWLDPAPRPRPAHALCTTVVAGEEPVGWLWLWLGGGHLASSACQHQGVPARGLQGSQGAPLLLCSPWGWIRVPFPASAVSSSTRRPAPLS